MKVLSSCPECGATVVASREPPSPMIHESGCSVTRDRKCSWCAGPMMPNARPNAVYCQDTCRAAHWKWATGYGRTDRPVGRERRANGKRSSPSGLQVSYDKAVAAMVGLLDGYEPSRIDSVEERVEAALRLALSEKQRARLDSRDAHRS